ncbi:MAG: helix-turn-helix domain-containing protein [Thermomicrobiales bacterium]
MECEFGRYLQRIRHLCGLTQDQLAERAGLSSRCISDLERGINASPRATTVGRLSDALQLDAQGREQMIRVAVCARDQVYGRALGAVQDPSGALSFIAADMASAGKASSL